MTIVLPFHQDERLSNGTIPAPASAVVLDPVLPEADQWTRVRAVLAALADEVAGQAGTATPVVVLTGDCLAAGGTLAGLQRAGADPAVVWLDAHADLNTLESSPSGYLGGISLRALIGGDADKLAGPLGLRPVAEERCLLAGARDIDPPEEEYLAGSGVRRVAVPELSAEKLPPGEILLHIDLDVIDGSEVPGMRFPVSGGPTSGQVVDAVRRIAATGRLVALEIAGVWTDAGTESERSARARLLESLVRAGRGREA